MAGKVPPLARKPNPTTGPIRRKMAVESTGVRITKAVYQKEAFAYHQTIMDFPLSISTEAIDAEKFKIQFKKSIYIRKMNFGA
ncbi:MAG TPA: hypothetical protein VEL68_02160 [Thermodesulfobacteriota bacterium]|nr:hypothetical protein [Thermodesulfobacteriota bacterium]